MKILTTPIDDLICLVPSRFADERGWFTEHWSRSSLEKYEIDTVFIQDNMSYSKHKGTLRGLHFQRLPFAQTKLVSVLRGRILDVAVDLRPESKTYGQHVAIELDDEGGMQILIPQGFAHGFCILTDDVVVSYKVDAPYSRDSEGGIIWNDPTLAIDWHLPIAIPILSDKDQVLPRFNDLDPSLFQGAQTS